MTGSAKQSTFGAAKQRLDCFVATPLAMTDLYLLNDGKKIHIFGGGAEPKMPSIESPSASSFASPPTGPSISSPTGKPPGVMPAYNDRPGMPALLPGSVLRIMMSNVGTGLSPLIDISPDPFSKSITCAGATVVGNRMPSRLLSWKYAS